MGWAALYGYFALVALLNLLLMRRPGPAPGGKVALLIPARNEAANLKELLPQALPQADWVYVFDDESTDDTGAVAADLGARVIRPSEPLPQGWTGKNRACHQLALYALEETDADWLLYLDADTRIAPDFVNSMRGLAASSHASVITGFPWIRPGRGIEPLFLAWVGWILLASNPFGLVSRSRMGHNRFLNGQVQMWRTPTYAEVWPNEKVKGRIMEDVQMGRELARMKIPVEVGNLSRVLQVRMYDTWRETLDGMSKNSYEITGSVAGSISMAALLLLVAWGWLAWPPAYGLLLLSGLAVCGTARAPVWPAPLLPIGLTIGAYTILRSAWWHKTGQVRWKGRTYPGN